MSWEIKFHKTTRGDSPVKEFIHEQDLPTRVKIASAIELLETDGPRLKPPYIKKLQSNLYELRISGKVAIRIFYTIKNGKYYLLHAFKKKSQKTPLIEIKTALSRLKDLVQI